LLVLGVLLFATSAFADKLLWEEGIETPADYGDRFYTRAHWTKFYINYGDSTQYVGAKYASVFDLPDLTQGYTAVHEDRDLGRDYGDNGNEVENFLRGLCDAPINTYLHAGGDYRVSPAFLKDQGQWVQIGDRREWVNSYFPLSFQGSGCLHDVPITRTKGDSYTYNLPQPKYPLSNPECLKQGHPSDVAGGVKRDGTVQYWYSKRSNQYGSIALSKDCAVAMYTHTGNMTSAKVTASFPYNIAVLDVKEICKQGATAHYDWCVVNQTPLKAKDVYITIWKKVGNQWILVEDHGRVEIPPATVSGWGEYRPGVLTKVQISEENYEVVVMANLNPIVFDGNGNATYINCQPLKTVYWSNALQGSPPPGVGNNGRREAIPIADFASALGFRVAEGYKDNVNYASAKGETPVPVPPRPEPPAGEKNLSCYSLEAYDADTGQEIISFQANQTIKAKAWYKSTFTFGGWARLRLYWYNSQYQQLSQVGNDINYFVEPEADFTYESWPNFGLGTGEYKLVASIDLYNNTDPPDINTGWQHELFDGVHEETTYDDNKYVLDLTGSETPYIPPEPVEDSDSGWYPPLAWVEIPGDIHEEEKTEDIYGWKEIPLTREEPAIKKKVRLVPNQPER